VKLRRLYLRDYRVLRDLEIQFQPGFGGGEIAPSYALDFLVGLNGSGKSTVIQAIAEIFRKLEASAPVPFIFELEYSIGAGGDERRVVVQNHSAGESAPDKPGELRVYVSGQEAKWSNDLLPSVIVAFTTGNEDEWLRVREPAEENASTASDMSAEQRAVRELPGWGDRIKSPDAEAESGASRFRLMRHNELSLVTLCGLLEFLRQDHVGAEGLARVLRHSSIERVCGYSLRLRLNPGLAGPTVQEDFDRLQRFADRALRLGSDRLLVYDLTSDATTKARALLEEFGSGFDLFKTLSKLQRAAVEAERSLQEVNVFLERTPGIAEEGGEPESSPLHLLEWLSDGEQSFLGRMCLFTLLRQPDALILLDEPEVHFNDYWKRQIVSLLDGVLRGSQSHVLITTHSSIALSDVPREDIVILDRPGTYTVRSRSPKMATLGADPSDIMVHVFGAPHAAGQRAVSHILERIEADSPADQRRRQLERLRGQVGPGYWSYRIRRALMALEQPS